MKIAYDIPTPKKKNNAYGKGRFSKVFWDFYESVHQNVRIEFEDEQECKKAQRAFLNLMNYNKIYDVASYKDGTAMFLVKSETEED